MNYGHGRHVQKSIAKTAQGMFINTYNLCGKFIWRYNELESQRNWL